MTPRTVTVVAVLATACVHEIEREQSSIGAVTRQCEVRHEPDVRSAPAPRSIELLGASLWIFDAVELASQDVVGNASATIDSARAACDDGVALARDADGTPISLVSLTSEELADNEARTDGRRLTLEVGGGVTVSGIATIYYDHVVRGPGFFDAESTGTGMCILAARGTQCQRLESDGDTRLWPPAAALANRGAVVAGDRVLVYGCRRIAAFTEPCVVMSAPLAEIGDPGAYRAFNVFDGWIDDPQNASVIADSDGAITVFGYDGDYLLATFDVFSAEVSVARSEEPTHGFDHLIPIFVGAPSTNGFSSGGRVHAGLRGNAEEVHVTSRGPDGPVLLTSFEFFGGFE